MINSKCYNTCVCAERYWNNSSLRSILNGSISLACIQLSCWDYSYRRPLFVRKSLPLWCAAWRKKSYSVKARTRKKILRILRAGFLVTWASHQRILFFSNLVAISTKTEENLGRRVSIRSASCRICLWSNTQIRMEPTRLLRKNGTKTKIWLFIA